MALRHRPTITASTHSAPSKRRSILDKKCAAGPVEFGYPDGVMVSPRNTVQVSIEPALELVRKYNIPGPRYTSYPTAPQFSAAIDRAALLADVAIDLSLIHI